MENDVKELESIVGKLRLNLQKAETIISRLKKSSQDGVKKIFLDFLYQPEDDVTKACNIVDWGCLENDSFVKQRIIFESAEKKSVTEKLLIVETLFIRVTEKYQDGIVFIFNSNEWYLLFNLIINGDKDSRSARLICQDEIITRQISKLKDSASRISVMSVEGLEGDAIFLLWKAFKAHPI